MEIGPFCLLGRNRYAVDTWTVDSSAVVSFIRENRFNRALIEKRHSLGKISQSEEIILQIMVSDRIKLRVQDDEVCAPETGSSDDRR